MRFEIWLSTGHDRTLTGTAQATASVDYATDELISKTIRESVCLPSLLLQLCLTSVQGVYGQHDFDYCTPDTHRDQL
jgi:hypothetical protein